MPTHANMSTVAIFDPTGRYNVQPKEGEEIMLRWNSYNKPEGDKVKNNRVIIWAGGETPIGLDHPDPVGEALKRPFCREQTQDKLLPGEYYTGGYLTNKVSFNSQGLFLVGAVTTGYHDSDHMDTKDCFNSNSKKP